MEQARATEQSDQPIKSNPGTPHKRPFRVVSSDDGLLFDLLRQLGEIPYIKREDEEAYGRELASCRLAFTDLVQDLPVTERAFVFSSHTDPSMQQSREHVISCYQRLVQQATDYPESRAAAVLPRAKELTRRLDRAWNMLTRSHLRFVVKVAKEVGAGRMPLIDLVQEGAMGLMTAVDRYDPERGYRLMTYAYWWIKRSVTLAIENKSQVIRIPRSIRQRLFRLAMASSELRESLGRQPTQREIADEMKTSIGKVVQLQSLPMDPTPLGTRDSSESSHDVLDAVCDPNGTDPLDEALEDEKRERLRAAMRNLTPVEQRALFLRYGLDGDPPKTLQEVGEVMGKSREGVRQIERRAFGKLRLEKDVLDLGSHFQLKRRRSDG